VLMAEALLPQLTFLFTRNCGGKRFRRSVSRTSERSQTPDRQYQVFSQPNMLVEAKSIINHLQERASLLNGQEVTSLVLRSHQG